VRHVETAALDLRDAPPDVGLEIDDVGLDITLPFERPLYSPPTSSEVESLIPPATAEIEPDLLFTQTFVDQARLASHIRAVLPPRSAALLSDIIAMYPLEQGAAEIIGYLALDDEDVAVEMDESDETLIDFEDPSDPTRTRRARLPKVTVRRR
jgi:hypothetical protein